jgi:hypothetical protein
MRLEGVDAHPIDAIDVTLAKSIGDTLEFHYPGWGWAVNVNSEQGIATVENIIISGRLLRHYGFLIKMDQLVTHDEIKRQAIQSGGEILERAGVARGPYRGQEINLVEGVKPHHQPLMED